MCELWDTDDYLFFLLEEKGSLRQLCYDYTLLGDKLYLWMDGEPIMYLIFLTPILVISCM